MAGPSYELSRSFEVFNYLTQFPADAQDFIRQQMREVRRLTDRPFGVNIAQAFVAEPDKIVFADAILLELLPDVIAENCDCIRRW